MDHTWSAASPEGDEYQEGRLSFKAATRKEEDLELNSSEIVCQVARRDG